MKEFQGVCKHCGNIQPILALDQNEADYLISMQCDCGAAEREMQKNLLIENIKSICDGCDSGMPQLRNELTEKVVALGMLVFNGTAASITAEIGKTKIKIARSGEKIKTSRTMNRRFETTA